MRDASQFDLVVVGDQQFATVTGNERRAEHLAHVAAYGNVVKIRVFATEATRARNGLIEDRVDPTVPCHDCPQTLAVSSAQLFDFAVLEQRIDELRPFVAELFQRRGIGAVTGLRLLALGKTALVEEDFLQLRR